MRLKGTGAGMISKTKCLTAFSALLLIASCSNQPKNEPELAKKSKSDLTSLADEDLKNMALLATAEAFETLTESSFSADVAMRESKIARVRKSAAIVTEFASPKLAARLRTHLADIAIAEQDNVLADLAIASIEAFRDLVSAVEGKQALPVNVSLLDYAGFRFDADAQANPARFADMQEAVVFAQEQWAVIKSRQEVAKLSVRFSAALDNMELASRSGDAALARATAKVELDMVDELEAAFGQ